MAEVRETRQLGVAPNGRKFDSSRLPGANFNKMKIGAQTLKDNVTLTSLGGASSSTLPTAVEVESALEKANVETLRTYSNIFFNANGIYSRLCTYMAHLFRYDWYVTPNVYSQDLADSDEGQNKIVDGWYKSCRYLENCDLKHLFGDVALKVMRQGCYYGYRVSDSSGSYLQELPVKYCRSRYSWRGRPTVEFNVKFFDESFTDRNYRDRVLKMFPKDVQKAYNAYKAGTLPRDQQSDDRGWTLLDPTMTVKFNLNGSDIPFFVSTIPQLINLSESQGLDRAKMEQQLTKILVQKFPLTKTGEIIFDVDDMNSFHNMAVAMLSGATGVDVLSTLADISVEDMADNSASSRQDQLEKVERGVFNSAGVSRGMFNPEGNIAMDKNISKDEAAMSDLLYQFESYSQTLLEPYNKRPEVMEFKVQILPTTAFNYQKLSDLYKSQTMMGFSKLLPQVALGHSQCSIISAAVFENKILSLGDVFVAPQLGSTISAGSAPSSGKVGRPEKDDSEKSDKTIKNLESK